MTDEEKAEEWLNERYLKGIGVSTDSYARYADDDFII